MALLPIPTGCGKLKKGNNKYKFLSPSSPVFLRISLPSSHLSRPSPFRFLFTCVPCGRRSPLRWYPKLFARYLSPPCRTAVSVRDTYRKVSNLPPFVSPSCEKVPCSAKPAVHLTPNYNCILFAWIYGFPLGSRHHHSERRKYEQAGSTEATVDAYPPTFVA